MLYGQCENGELKNSALEGFLNITYNEVSKTDPFGIKIMMIPIRKKTGNYSHANSSSVQGMCS